MSGLSEREPYRHPPQFAGRYQSCVLDDAGNCSRWNHDHPPATPTEQPVVSGLPERDVERLAEHEPVIGHFADIPGIVGCSCLSARDYRAAGFRAGQAGWREHIASTVVAAIRDDAKAEVVTSILAAAPRLNAELRHDGTSDPGMSAYVEGWHDALAAARAALDGGDQS